MTCVSQKIHEPVKRQCSTEDNLRAHGYAALIPRPQSDYVGPDRIERTDPKRLGMPRHERNFSLKTNSTWGFQWTVGDQAIAVQAGFFLHRSGYANRVNIIGVNPFDDAWPTEDGFACLAQIERLAFEQPNTLVYQRALNFIKQQDQFGYSGAWETDEIAFFSSQMQWYRVWYAKRKATQTGNVSKHSRAVIDRVKRTASFSKRARLMRNVSFVRKVIDRMGYE